jgi:L-fuconolactonase
MGVVDSHCHVSPIWFEPVESLLFQMDRYGVERAVLIQMLGQYENQYQVACATAHPDRLRSVVGIDWTHPKALDQLRRAADLGVAGIRLRPGSRSPGSDPLAIWRVAEECRLGVSCVGTVESFNAPEFADVIAQVPMLPVVLEHFAGQARPDETEDARAARRKGLLLSRFPNVFLKVPGLGELMPRLTPPSDDGSLFRPGARVLIDAAVNAFGADRLMWGSDFPVVASREGYGNALSGCREACAHLPQQARKAIFGETAIRVFK